MGRAFYYKAQVEYTKDNLSKCEKLCLKSLKILQENKPCLEIAYICNILGIINDLKGNIVLGVDYYIKAIRYCEITENLKLLSMIYNNIATIHMDIYDYKNAVKYLKIALKLYKKCKPTTPKTLYYIYANLCICYNGLSDVKNLIQTYEKWQESCEKNPKYNLSTRCNYIICAMFIQIHLNNREKAKEIFKTFMSEIVDIFDADLLKDMLRTVQFWIKRNYIDEAKEFMDLCGQWIAKYNIKNFDREYSYCMVALAKKLNDDNLKNKMITKYYEACEQDRVNLQIINAENLKNKIKVFEMENKVRESEIKAITDNLTGIYNRQALSYTILPRFELACKARQTVAFAFIDIDDFKKFNDKYGHSFGDKCLTTIANEINKLCNNKIVPIRYGGDEFLIIFLDTDKDEVIRNISKLYSSIASHQIKSDDGTIDYLTVSTGICLEAVNDESDFYNLIVKADRALYRSKEIKNTFSFSITDD